MERNDDNHNETDNDDNAHSGLDNHSNQGNHDHNHYDVAILGCGITGSSLAAILARQGLRVAVFDSGEHPRFAIGESMILETSETLRAMAGLFDVPELGFFASENCLPLIGTSHGVKRHFGFVMHKKGQEPDRERDFQAVIPRAPYGHELHLFRQDCDSFLAATAVHYGATLLQRTEVDDVQIDGAGVEISTRGGSFRAQYIVDAGGLGSQLAKAFGLRHDGLRTHSRGIFTHMVDVPVLADPVDHFLLCLGGLGRTRRVYGKCVTELVAKRSHDMRPRISAITASRWGPNRMCIPR